MTEPCAAVCKHLQVAFFEGADIWLEVMIDMFPVSCQCFPARRGFLSLVDLLPCFPSSNELRSPTVRAFERQPTGGIFWKWWDSESVAAVAVTHGRGVGSLRVCFI